MAKEKENGAPATSPTLLGRLANLAGLGGSAQPAEATAAAPAPSAPVLAVPLTDEPTSVIPNGSVEQPVTSASASTSTSVPAGEPTVAAAEDRVPSPPPPPSPQAAPLAEVVDVPLAPLPASLQQPNDGWQDASHLLADGGSVAQAAPAPVPAQAPSGVFAALAAGYNAGRKGEALPRIAPAAQAAPTQSESGSTPITGIFGRFLRISASNGAEVPAAVAPSPSSSETPPVRKSISEALVEGYRAGSTPKPVTPPPADTTSFVARLEGERVAPPPAGPSMSI